MFDSGVGGLTVARAVLDLLPHEPLLYVGDTARSPYGPRRPEEIRRYALEIADYLVHRDVKMLVVACNSVEVSAIGEIADRAHIPVVGVVEPGTRAAARQTRNRIVGMIGTQATVSQRALRSCDGRDGRSHHPALQRMPGVRGARGAGRYDQPGATRGRARVSFSADGCRHRHLDPWLHALPPAGRAAPARAGTRRGAGLLGRRDRQGRVRLVARRRPAAGRDVGAAARVPRHGRSRGLRTGRGGLPRT